MDEHYRIGMSAGVFVGNLLFWFGLVPLFESRSYNMMDFYKGLTIGTLAVLLTYPTLYFFGK